MKAKGGIFHVRPVKSKKRLDVSRLVSCKLPRDHIFIARLGIAIRKHDWLEVLLMAPLSLADDSGSVIVRYEFHKGDLFFLFRCGFAWLQRHEASFG